MRPLRKIAIASAIVLVSCLAILAIIPALFGDRIAARLKAEIDASIDARVAWGGLGISLLRDFPNVAVTVNGLSVSGIHAFAGDTLVATRQAKLVLDLGSVIGYLRSGKPIVVRELSFDQPVVRLRRLADGTANWNITRAQPAQPSGPARAVNITLRHFGIGHGTVTVDDRASNVTASVHGLDESLNGDFASDRFVLSTRTRADSVSAMFGGIPYLNRVALDLDARIDADVRAHRFVLTKETLRLNKLVLAVGGTVTTGAPNLGLDVRFSAPSTAFAEILSLVPTVYARDFDRLQTSGTMSISGQIRGEYGAKAFPQLAVSALVENGSFRYPDLPLATRDIALDLAVENPGGAVDNTIINLKRFHARIGSRPIDGSLVLSTPVSDPDATLRLAGSLDLADVARTVKLQNVSTLSGIVAADLSTHARVSDVDAKRYDRIAASGSLHASRIALRSSTIPHPIAIDTAALLFTPRNAELTAFSSTIGASDARATGTLDNLVGFLLRDEDLRGHATVSSTRLDLNEWMSGGKSQVIGVPARVDFALDASADHVAYGVLTLANVKGSLQVKDRRASVRSLTMGMLRGTVVADGYYETLNPSQPVFNVTVGLTTLDIPNAFASLTTVQKLAPIAQYAQGRLSGTMSLAGALGRDMLPVFSALTGKGEITTDGLVLRGAPVMQKLSSTLSLAQFESPALGALHASVDISDGRLHVKPFKVNVGGVDLSASGSNGIDQSLSYDLALAIPRSLLGPAATSKITTLASKAGALGAQLPSGDVVQLLAKVTGTVASPSVSTNFAGMAASMAEAAQTTARQVAATVTQTGTQKVDSVADVAAAKARAEADRIVGDAERQADTIRTTAQAVVERMRHEANAHIDSLVAAATNPIAKIAARKAADQLRKQTDQQADNVLRSANARADSLVAQAKQKAALVTKSPP